MLLQLLSDLHLEFGPLTIPETDADVVVLAGDIHLGVKGVEWAKKVFSKPVIYVPGNHEAYKHNLDTLGRKLDDAAHGSNVHVLQEEGIIIEGTRFIGSTLWTDFALYENSPAAMRAAQLEMSDYKQIRIGQAYRRARPEDTRKIHLESLAKIEAALAMPFGGRTVVVTHHAPSIQSLSPEYAGDILNASYASHLHRLFGPAVSLWLHGHSHHSADYVYGGTRVVANPRGYARDELNPDFNPGLVLELN